MKVGIIGSGVLGSVQKDWLLKNTDNEVLVYDIDKRKSNSTLDSMVKFSDIIFICIPTDGKEDGDLYCDDLDEVLSEISENVSDDKLLPVVIRSTVPTGYCRHQNDDAMNRGIEIFFYPEFLTEKTADVDFQCPKKVVIGCPEDRLSELQQGGYYALQYLLKNSIPAPKVCKMTFVDYEIAETLKLATNSFYALKVTFANELADYCKVSKIDYELLKDMLCLDPRIGSGLFDNQGVDVHFRIAQDGLYGFGGKCLPKDIAQLANLMKNSGTGYGLLDKTIAINKKIRKGKI